MHNLSSSPTILNTILWSNTAPSGGAQINNDISTPSVSNSVVQGGCPTGSTCTNILSTDPNLGTLGDHGGFTQTIPLLPGSSAINAGNDATCATTDQRGITRPQGEHCDIGAYESDFPTVVSSVRANADPTTAASVNFTVTFSETVSGVDTSDFALTATGLTGTSVTSVSGSGVTYTVTVNTGTGTGTIRLDVIDDDSIVDAVSNPLGGAGLGNGNFNSGEIYTVSIDLDLPWNTFIGSADLDYGWGMAIDGSGNVYVTGASWATWGTPVRAFTVNAGTSDAFVAKLNSTGVMQWHTFLGATGWENGWGIAVDGSGNVYINGYSTATWGSPVNPYAGNGDAFVVKLNSNGVLQWNTFLGSSSADEGHGIAVDGNGNVYVTGDSAGNWGVPINAYTPPTRDPFVAKLNDSGVLLWNTFIGSADYDSGVSITIDGSGNVYATGYSSGAWGSPVNTYAGRIDVFVAKLNDSGFLQWNTFLGSATDDDYGWSITMDGGGNVYISGGSNVTWGSPIRSHGGEGNDAFVVKLNSNGVLQWNTFLGSSSADEGHGIAVDGSGNVYATGWSLATWGNPVNSYAGGFDAFVAKLNSYGILQWNTFLGSVYHDEGNAITVDGSGIVYVVGISEATWGAPINPFAGRQDAFVSTVPPSAPPPPPTPTTTSISPISAMAGGSAFILTVNGTNFVNGSIVQWNGANRTTNFVSVTQLTAAIPATDIAETGVALITMFNPAPGGGTSNGLPFFITTTDAPVTGYDMATGDNPTAGFGGVTTNATGNGTLVVAQYASNPGGTPTFAATGQYYDVHINPPGAFTQVIIQFCGLTSSDTIYFWNGIGWGQASNQTYAAGCWTVTVSAVTVPTLADLGGAVFGVGHHIYIETTAPSVVSSVRADPNPTTAASVHFTVTFSEAVTSVDMADFTLTVTGVTGASVTNVSGGPTAYTVKVNTGTGSGTLRLNVVDNDSIKDGSGNPLGGVGAGNGNFTGGETYTVSKMPIFADVPSSYWANSWIERLFSAGITSGCGIKPLIYCPEQSVTRAQMAIFLERGMNGSAFTPPAGTGTIFADVPLNYWAVNWVEKLFADGITTGCNITPLNFCPDNSVTRAEMAVFLLRAKYGASYTPPAATGVFADVPTTHWAANWIEQLYAEGITTGCGSSPLTYCPEDSVTRAQMAVFLVRTFNLP